MKKYIILYLISIAVLFFIVLGTLNQAVPEPDGKVFVGADYVTSGGYSDGELVESYEYYYTDEATAQYAKELKLQNLKLSVIITPIVSLLPCLILFIIIRIRNRKTST